jgi:DNA-directed RNA polymerase specialized sigma subunit
MSVKRKTKMKTTTPNNIDPSVEFPKVEKMLYNLAWKTAETYPITFEDAKSEAYWAFMKACQDYNPDRGQKFSSWCYFWVWTRLKDVITFRTKDPLTFIEIDEDLLGEAPPTQSESLEVIESLSSEAREIVAMLLESPKELIGQVTTTNRLLNRVKDYMVRKGIKKDRVEEAVTEITIALRQSWGQPLPV